MVIASRRSTALRRVQLATAGTLVALMMGAPLDSFPCSPVPPSEGPQGAFDTPWFRGASQTPIVVGSRPLFWDVYSSDGRASVELFRQEGTGPLTPVTVQLERVVLFDDAAVPEHLRYAYRPVAELEPGAYVAGEQEIVVDPQATEPTAPTGNDSDITYQDSRDEDGGWGCTRQVSTCGDLPARLHIELYGIAPGLAAYAANYVVTLEDQRNGAALRLPVSASALSHPAGDGSVVIIIDETMVLSSDVRLARACVRVAGMSYSGALGGEVSVGCVAQSGRE